MKYSIPLTIITLLLAASSLSAATHYVSLGSTNPAPPYTNWATAARNIQDAADVAEAGDTVVVSNGVYTGGGRLTYGAWNRVAVTSAIALVSVNGAQSTVIDGGANAQDDYESPSATNRCVSLTDGASLTGFTVTNGFLGYIPGGGVYCTSEKALIINCILTGNASKYGGGGAYGGTLYNCTVTGNSSYLWGTTGVVGCTLYNCIVYFNGGYYDFGYNLDGTSTLNYCCTPAPPLAGVGNITNDPLFVAYSPAQLHGYSNLHLQFDSPCINAGNNAYVMTTNDADGNPRIVGGTVDIGAYEYQGSTTFGGVPQVSTLPATGVSTDIATLKGTVNPNFYPTTAWFQWGTTTNYGNLTSVTSLGSGTTALPLSAPLAGLTRGATYHFRVAATNSCGAVYGSDQSFTTTRSPTEFNYTTNNGTITITGYTGPGGAVTVPNGP